MQLDEQKPDLTEADKRLATGKKILITITVVRFCCSLVDFFLDGSILFICLAVIISVVLASGVVRIKWYYLIPVGILHAIKLLLLQSNSFDIPVYSLAYSIAIVPIDIATLAVLAFSKKVNEYIEQRQRGYHDHHSYRGSEHQRISGEYRKTEEKKPCPLCGEDIAKTHIFCPSCGGDIAIKEEENMQIWREKLEKDGYGVLLANEKAKNDLREMRRVYGADCCISYLKEKAQELGIPGLEITADDLDGILGVG